MPLLNLLSAPPADNHVNKNSIRLIAAVVAGLVFSDLPAAAQEQEPTQRPYRTVFGGGVNANSNEVLNVTMTLDGSYDDNVLAEQLPGGDPRFGQSGWYPTATAAMQYTRRGRRVNFNAGATTALQYYSGIEGTLDRNHGADVGIDINSTRYGRLRLAQSAAYATYYTMLGLPGAVLPDVGAPVPPTSVPDAQLGVSTETGAEYHTGASWTREFGRRGAHSVEGRYGLMKNDFTTRQDTVHDIGGTFRFGVTRRAAVRAGYGYQTGAALDAAGIRLHNIDAGLEYRRNLPGLRNTTFSASSGSAVVTGPGTRDYRLLADVTVEHLMGRSWTASGAYHRGFEYIGVLSNLVASDEVTGTVGGYVNPALQLTFSGSYSLGHLGVRHGAEMITYSGIARAQYGLSRDLAVHADYLYYLYDFGEDAVLPTGLPNGLTRHGISFGLVFQLPVIR